MGEPYKRKISCLVSDFFRVVIACMTIMVVMFFLRGLQEWLLNSKNYQLRKVVIKGSRFLSAKEILSNTDLCSQIDILHVNLTEVERQIRRNPFIASAYVTKRFPAAIEIEIRERLPVAYVNGTELMSVDSKGVILPLPKSGSVSDLPVITGIKKLTGKPGQQTVNDTLLQAVEILTKCPKSLYRQISEVHFDQRYGFLLYLTDYYFPIYLGQGAYSRKLQYLQVLLLRLWKEKRLASLYYVDLRFENQAVVR